MNLDWEETRDTNQLYNMPNRSLSYLPLEVIAPLELHPDDFIHYSNSPDDGATIFLWAAQFFKIRSQYIVGRGSSGLRFVDLANATTPSSGCLSSQMMGGQVYWGLNHSRCSLVNAPYGWEFRQVKLKDIEEVMEEAMVQETSEAATS